MYRIRRQKKRKYALTNIRLQNLRHNLDSGINSIEKFLRSASHLIRTNSGLGRRNEEEFVEVDIIIEDEDVPFHPQDDNDDNNHQTMKIQDHQEIT